MKEITSVTSKNLQIVLLHAIKKDDVELAAQIINFLKSKNLWDGFAMRGTSLLAVAIVLDANNIIKESLAPSDINEELTVNIEGMSTITKIYLGKSKSPQKKISALELAVRSDNLDLVQYLIEKGADLKIQIFLLLL